MICFEVYVNGQLACTAGVGKGGVLSAILDYVKRDPACRPKHLPDQLWQTEELNFNVGGMISQKKNNYVDRFSWINQTATVGDEIRIVIVNKRKCDTPKVRKEKKETGKA